MISGLCGVPATLACVVVLIGVAVFGGGCASDVSPQGTLDAAVDVPRALPQCIPGMAVACACPEGTTGAQSCDSAGRYEPCVCRVTVSDASSGLDVISDARLADDVPTGAPIEAAAPCGAGTVEVDGGCVGVGIGDGGLSYFDLRASLLRVSGDGRTPLPLLALGREADGTPSTRDVVFWVSRAGAGTVTPTARLAAAGTTVEFVPCNASTSSSCAGSVRILMGLASAPAVPVAVSPEITITAQPAVGSIAPCLGGGNVAYVTGDPTDYITSGRSFMYRDAQITANSPTPTVVGIALGSGEYSVQFSSRQLMMPLIASVYENGMRYPFETAGRPGLSLSGMGRGCNMLAARFQIHEITWDGASLSAFSATFEQRCEGGSSAARGCIVWRR